MQQLMPAHARDLAVEAQCLPQAGHHTAVAMEVALLVLEAQMDPQHLVRAGGGGRNSLLQKVHQRRRCLWTESRPVLRR